MSAAQHSARWAAAESAPGVAVAGEAAAAPFRSSSGEGCGRPEADRQARFAGRQYANLPVHDVDLRAPKVQEVVKLQNRVFLTKIIRPAVPRRALRCKKLEVLNHPRCRADVGVRTAPHCPAGEEAAGVVLPQGGQPAQKDQASGKCKTSQPAWGNLWKREWQSQQASVLPGGRWCRSNPGLGGRPCSRAPSVEGLQRPKLLGSSPAFPPRQAPLDTNTGKIFTPFSGPLVLLRSSSQKSLRSRICSEAAGIRSVSSHTSKAQCVSKRNHTQAQT